MELRDYQKAAVDAAFEKFKTVDRTCIVLPTGTGKTVVMSAVVKRCLENGGRVMVIAHTNQLITQINDTVIKTLGSSENVGYYTADKKDYVHKPVVIGSARALDRIKDFSSFDHFDLVIIDEAHHYAAGASYKTLVRLGAIDNSVSEGTAKTKLLGFTATFRREDNKDLMAVMPSIAYEKDLQWAIEKGYLTRPKGKQIALAGFNGLKKISKSLGDYAFSALQNLVLENTENIVTAIFNNTTEGKMIIFVPGIENGIELVRSLNKRVGKVEEGERESIKAGFIHGGTPEAGRKKLLQRFQKTSGRDALDALVNVGVLTEGVDLPICDTIVLARPTQSLTLYTQMVGRALRLYDNKEDATVLDLVGTSRDKRLIGLTQLVPNAIIERARGDEKVEFNRSSDKLVEVILPRDDLVAHEFDVLGNLDTKPGYLAQWNNSKTGAVYLAGRLRTYVCLPISVDSVGEFLYIPAVLYMDDKSKWKKQVSDFLKEKNDSVTPMRLVDCKMYMRGYALRGEEAMCFWKKETFSEQVSPGQKIFLEKIYNKPAAELAKFGSYRYDTKCWASELISYYNVGSYLDKCIPEDVNGSYQDLRFDLIK